MSTRRRRHTPEQIVRKLRHADAMLNAGKDEAAVLHALEVTQSTYDRWRNQYGGMKAEEARRLKELEDEIHAQQTCNLAVRVPGLVQCPDRVNLRHRKPVRHAENFQHHRAESLN